MRENEIIEIVSDINEQIPEVFINNGICVDYRSNGNCECIQFMDYFLWDSENGYSYGNYKYNDVMEDHYNPDKEILMQIMWELVSDLKNIFGDRTVDDGEHEDLFSWPCNGN